MRTARSGTSDGRTGPSRIAARLRQLHRLEAASLIEGSTLVLLVFVAVPLKYLGGWPIGVVVVGPVHGLAFLFYMLSTIELVTGGGWTRGATTRLLLAAVIPFGGFVNLPLLSRRRRAATERLQPISEPS